MPFGSSCAKKSDKVKGNRWRRELEEYACDNKNKVGSTDAESKEERDGEMMNVDSFPVVTSLTVEHIAFLYVISARPGVQQHFIEAGREQRPAISLGSWTALTYTFPAPEVFCYCYPN